jgi:hypothetical protein
MKAVELLSIRGDVWRNMVKESHISLTGKVVPQEGPVVLC